MVSLQKRSADIFFSDATSAETFLASSSFSSRARWIYLGKDVSRCITLGKKTGRTSQQIEIGPILQKTAMDIRPEYIDYIGNLRPADDNLYWWLTSASEKNPRVSDIFLNTCYLLTIKKILDEAEYDLVIVCESPGLAAAIEYNFNNLKDWNISIHTCCYDRTKRLVRSAADFLSQYVFFLIRWTMRILLAWTYGAGPSSAGVRDNTRKSPRGCIIIHSWIDQRSFMRSGQYDEVYLGSLGSELEKLGFEVIYLADVLPTLLYGRALHNLRQLKCPIFFLMEEFLSPVDPFVAAYVGLFKIRCPRTIPVFRGLDISAFVTEEFYRDRHQRRAPQTYLSYLVGRRIAQSNPFQSFVYSFENLMWEKMFCISIREEKPATEIIGYAHSVIDPMYLFYSLSRAEQESAPLPDRIIVNGSSAKDSLVHSGFPPSMIFIGGALRYPNLGKPPAQREYTGKKTLLIATSAGIGESIELIGKAYLAFRDRDDISCIIKVHPTIPLNAIPDLRDLPSNFSLRDDPVHDLFPLIDLMVYTSSAISVEAIACGIPILHVKSDFTIDMNIFAGSPMAPSVSTPGELVLKAKEILDGPPLSREDVDGLVSGFFAPVTRESIELFVPHE